MNLFEKAVVFAAEKHNGQKRKVSFIPFLVHPMEVASIAATMTNDEEVLAAAVLHDTVEDTDTTADEVEHNFGHRVMSLVASETENKRKDLPPEATWRIRKEESLAVIAESSDEAVKMLWLGDKLSNMRSFYREYLTKGDALWNGFHQSDPREQAWYYRAVARCLVSLSEHEAYKEFVRLTECVFENVPTE